MASWTLDFLDKAIEKKNGITRKVGGCSEERELLI